MSADLEVLGEGKYLRLLSRRGWEYAERKGSRGVVAIVALTADGRLILTEQHRAAVAGRVLDLPAGLAGDVAGQEDEPLEAAALRELEEEVGYHAERMERLARVTPSPGMSSEVVTFFRAHGLTRRGAGGGDASEAIQVHEVSLVALPAWLEAQEARGALVDVKLFAGMYFAGAAR